jgi:hypothetical protein
VSDRRDRESGQCWRGRCKNDCMGRGQKSFAEGDSGGEDTAKGERNGDRRLACGAAEPS